MRRGRRTWAVAAGAVVVAAVAVSAALLRPQPPAPAAGPEEGRRAFLLDPPTPAADFRLTDQHGREFRLADQRGRAVLLFFGYTHCPDVCPTTLVTFKAVKDQLGGLANRVRFVFVTVDPERDTPQRLREYVGHYDDDFVGLWGSPEQIRTVTAAYGVLAEKAPQEGAPDGYWVVHSASTLLVAPDGRLWAVYPFGTSSREMAGDLRRLLS